MKVLFADDETPLQELMRDELPLLGHQVTVCPDGLTAAAALEKNTYDCVLVDLDMPGMNGIEVITRAKELSPDTEAVVLTGKSSLETAVAALRQGAFDYLTKPYKWVAIEALLDRVARKRELTKRCAALQHQLRQAEGDRSLIGTGRTMELVRESITQVAPTTSTVLIRGETGSGKELVARAVHEQSPRAGNSFVAINCGSVARNVDRKRVVRASQGSLHGRG